MGRVMFSRTNVSLWNTFTRRRQRRREAKSLATKPKLAETKSKPLVHVTKKGKHRNVPNFFKHMRRKMLHPLHPRKCKNKNKCQPKKKKKKKKKTPPKKKKKKKKKS